MSNEQTAAEIRRWCDAPYAIFSWPTDACGYDQHMKFIRHRNSHWQGGTPEEFKAFCRAYADDLELIGGQA